MKRMRVHIAVRDLPASVRFYATLFAAEPTVSKPGYAKWMLDDPRMNFAIGAREGAVPGRAHLGIQIAEETGLATVDDRPGRAERLRAAADNDGRCCA